MSDEFNELSVRFCRAIKDEYGSDKCNAAMRALRDVLGTDWAGQVVLDVLSDKYKTYNKFVLHSVGDKVIETIKAIRNINYMGLKEAKDLFESVRYSDKTSVIIADKEDMTAAEANSFIQEMRRLGNTVTQFYG